jgi:hypothetical protein
MCAKPIRREGTEERPSDIGTTRQDVDGPGDVPQAKADLPTLPGLEQLLGALPERCHERKPGSHLRTYRRSEK